MDDRSRKVQINQFYSSQKASMSQAGLKRLGGPELPDDIQAQLIGVGLRVRKSVSDGYKYQTSIPSYQGMTIGHVNTGSFQFVDGFGMPVAKDGSLDSSRHLSKRARDDEEDADTDVDDPVETTRKIYYTPKSGSFQSIVDDFEEADFLVAKEDVVGE